MRLAIGCVSLIISSIALTACGQTGPLYATDDPNYDQRAKYLLYKNPKPSQVAASEPVSTTP